MKRFKAIAAVGTALALSLSLTACGSSSHKGATANKDPNTLTVWAWDPHFNIYAMKEAEKIYQKDHPKFHLKLVETAWDDLQTKLTTLAQSNKIDGLPDILLIQNNAFQKNVKNYPKLFNTFEGSAVKYDEFPKSVTDYSTVNSKHYGLPFDSGTAIAVYRKDLLQKAGLTVKDMTDITWDQFIEKGKIVKAKTGKPLLTSVANQSDLLMMMVQSAGGSLFDKAGKPVLVKNPIVKKAAQTYVKLVKSGVLEEKNSWDEYVGSFVNSNVAGVVNGVWILGSIQTAKNQAGKWEITNLPKLDGIDSATHYSANGGSSWAITANANVKLAQDFLAKTFGASTQLFDTILPKAGAVANWLPAGKSKVYNAPVKYFNNEPIFAKVVDFGKKVPVSNSSTYYYEGRDAMSAALTQMVQGTDIDSALKSAQQKVEFDTK